MSQDSDETHRSEPPLWSMGLAVIVVLAAPLILYSQAPSGPLRAGDTIFSQGQQDVRISTSLSVLGKNVRNTCLLDPDNPLIILELQHEDLDGDILATVQGNPDAEWPFCPLHAQVLIKPHQMFQKPDLWNAPRRLVTGLFQN